MTTFDRDAERAFLNGLVPDYTDVSPYSEVKKRIIMALVAEHLGDHGRGRGLQLGCANGYETKQLADRLEHLMVVDGSSVFVDRLVGENLLPNVTFRCALFEDVHAGTDPDRYDYIFCSYVLEHVFDPQVILRNMASLLAPGGRMFIVVPNCRALSRQLALHMGLLERLEDLTENDHRHGHRRVYDRESLVSQVESAGLEVRDVRGVILKILADFQLNQLLGEGFLTPEHVVAMQAVAEAGVHNSGLADSIFVAAAAV